MSRTRPLIGITFLLAILFFLGGTGLGLALTLQEAKSQGLLGERPTGYLGVVDPSAPPEAYALMEEVNQKRRAKYEEIARKNGTTLEAVEALAGKRAIQKTQPGHMIQLSSGQWIRK